MAAGDAPYLLAMTANAAGQTWWGAAGTTPAGDPPSPDTPFRIYSMTKAVAAVAAMILVERGRFSLDTQLRDVLPEFGELRVLDGFDGDRPVLRPARTSCTIRHLLTHTSGLEYEFWNGDVARYLAATATPSVMSGRLAGLRYPLTFDPGTRWAYGIGIDWLGRAIEAADGRAVDRFCADEIFGPLGMEATTFAPDAAVRSRLPAPMQRRDGGFSPSRIELPDEPEFFGMGYALVSTGQDYVRFLRMLLGRGVLDGRRLVAEATVAALLAKQTGDLTIGPMRSVSPKSSADVDLFPGLRKSHSLAFLRLEADAPGMRRAGAQFWGGILNTHCWLDPAGDVAAVFMTQLLPFADPRLMRALDAFERAVYRAAPGSGS